MNRQLAEKLLEDSEKTGKKKEGDDPEGDKTSNPLGDSRFAAMFTDANFEVEEESEEFQRLHPVLSHREKKRKGKKGPLPPPSVEERAGSEVYNSYWCVWLHHLFNGRNWKGNQVMKRLHQTSLILKCGGR